MRLLTRALTRTCKWLDIRGKFTRAVQHLSRADALKRADHFNVGLSEYMRSFIDGILADALDQIRAAGVSVYTFAAYFDHESHALSVCVDTLEKSRATVASINENNSKYFHKAVASGDLIGASLWQANIGRSLSLGDFHLVNVGRRDLPSSVKASPEFFISLVQALVSIESEVAALSKSPDSIVFCCSGMGDEVEYCWSRGLNLPNQTIQRTPHGAADR